VIALDSSAVITYLAGGRGAAMDALDIVLAEQQACLPPVVLTELTSDPQLSAELMALFRSLPLLDVTDGYWHRAGDLRSRLMARGAKARLADTLIAQSCLDHDVALITLDRDFRHFAQHAGLRLIQSR
jgi:predicted nucleic acid-binding protein